MKKLKNYRCLITILAILLVNNLANAVNITVGRAQTIDNNSWLKVNERSEMSGTLNNYNRIDIEPRGDTYVAGVVNNHGYINVTDSAFSILQDYFPRAPYNGNNRKIVNHSGGTIIMSGYIDMYSEHALFENAGSFILLRESFEGLTAGMMMGTFKNTGFMQFYGVPNKNICQNSGALAFVNEGYLEIADPALCDFGEFKEGDFTTFTQNRGETRVNGTFGAHTIYVNNGMVSGKGNITGSFGDYPLFDAVTLSPGAPIGTLTLAPQEGYLMCVRCSIDIELAAANQADHVHVNGEFDMNEWKLNVLLRDGYVPAPGTHFTIVSANPVVYYGPAPKYNLPELPNGRTWDVQNTGNEVILTAN